MYDGSMYDMVHNQKQLLVQKLTFGTCNHWCFALTDERDLISVMIVGFS